MKTFDTVGLWVEAEDLGLIKARVSHFKDLKDRFGFDCNNLGSMQTSKRPEKILELILLIREKYSTTHAKCCGEHLEILGQVALRGDLPNSYVRWGRAYQLVPQGKRHEWVSLEEWLAENGHPYPHDDNRP